MCGALGSVVVTSAPEAHPAAVAAWYIGMVLALLCIVIPAVAATLERD